MAINTNDFRFIRSGSLQHLLQKDQVNLTSAIEQRNSGKQSALLMLHGFSSTPAVFQQLEPRLQGYDAIVSPILPGHAEDLNSFAHVNAQDWIGAVQSNCESLLKEYNQVDVIGLSLGGLLAYYISQRYNLHHLYLLAPSFDLRLPLIPIFVLLKVLRALGFDEFYNSGANIITKSNYDIVYRKIPLKVLTELFTLIKNFQCKPLRCPTDLFLGKKDEVVNVERVAKRFVNDPKVTIHWLNDSAHLLPLDGDVENIITCINQKNRVSRLDNTA